MSAAEGAGQAPAAVMHGLQANLPRAKNSCKSSHSSTSSSTSRIDTPDCGASPA